MVIFILISFKYYIFQSEQQICFCVRPEKDSQKVHTCLIHPLACNLFILQLERQTSATPA